ncbi:glycoside hydrolase family 3 protein [Sphingomonas sp. Leaf10]|uniref:glycoside hydrolase family 3 protein n=1 Tax=Sphingomonas sp. Leaf10 TaxID=1735676 RepID=UPI0006F795B1|nr:glycoside hydrolase family 3 C-terminal domain-containing protein [Sphingomonas sp. Leaf10]KQM35867.1 beta-glucosidase [Sphingomonas sp. Leaf10]
MLTADQQARMTAGASMWATVAVPEEGIPALRMGDGPMGIASGRVDERDVARLTPCAVSLGASFDPDLVARVGALVGGEAVRKGVDLVLAPNVNLARSPLAGRAFEYFSEDPLLAGLAGAAWVRGVQSTGTGAVPKHLVCNDSETDRDRVDVRVDERTLREVYLLPFELCAQAGAAAMLTAYNRVNGDWCAEAGRITTIVKAEWGFAGPLMSDWFGTHSTEGSLNGGLDLEMPGPGRFLGDKALAAIEDGRVPATRVVDAAARVSEAAKRWGGDKSVPATEDADELLVEAAAAGMVLLRNRDALLPIDPARLRRIAIIGPNATAPCYQGGTFAKISLSPDAPTPLAALRDRFGDRVELSHEVGADAQPRLPAMPATPLRDLGDGAVRGMTIDYFGDTDTGAAPIASETRDTNSLVWFVGVHDAGVFDQPAAIRAGGWFTPVQDGRHVFHVGATGAVRLAIDGDIVLDRAQRLAPGDVMGSLKRGDSETVAVDLVAGQPVRVEVTFTYDGARAHGLWYGVRGPDSAEAMLTRAVEAASAADAVVLMLGETADSSVESKDRDDTRLAADQLRLAQAVIAANPNTIVVVNVGHAFDATFAKDTAASLVVWYPGEGFGTALAQVLGGDREPGGRLPVTLAADEADYPAFNLTPGQDGGLPYDDGVLLGYRGLMARGVTPLHAFGSGIGYANFTLLDACVEGEAVIATVRNDSARGGSEVIQLYRHQPEPALLGFGRITLEAGATGEVRIAIEPRMLRVWRDGWQPIDGPVVIAVGRASDDLPLTVQYTPKRD